MGDIPVMNVQGATIENRFVVCPVTETSGSVLRKRDLSSFSLTESVYPKGLTLSKHCHSNAYLSFILSGTYREKYGERECICR